MTEDRFMKTVLVVTAVAWCVLIAILVTDEKEKDVTKWTQINITPAADVTCEVKIETRSFYVDTSEADQYVE